MTLHFFIQGAAWQLQFVEYRLDVAFMPGEGGSQALRFKGFLLRHE